VLVVVVIVLAVLYLTLTGRNHLALVTPVLGSWSTTGCGGRVRGLRPGAGGPLGIHLVAAAGAGWRNRLPAAGEAANALLVPGRAAKTQDWRTA
jgi:hypothetical protein